MSDDSISKTDTCNRSDESENCIKDEEEIEGTIEEALKATGIGSFNVWIIITAGLIIYTVNSKVWAIGYVIPTAECDLELSLKQKSILVTAGSVGITTTLYFWGYLSDRIGRRNVILYTLAAGCVCTIISALVPIFWMLVLCRFLNGAFVACPGGLIFAYIGEFFSTRYRSVAISVMSIFVGLSMTSIPLLAWLIIPAKFTTILFGSNLASWRVFLLASGLSAIPAWIFLYFSPESPKYLAQVQRNEEALQLLDRMRRMNKKKEGIVIQKLTVEGANDKNVRIWDLFNSKYIWKTLLVCTLQAGVYGPAGGLSLWYPDILKKVTKSKEVVTVCQALNLPMDANLVDYTSLQNGTLRNNGMDECHITMDSSVYVKNIVIGLAFTVAFISNSAIMRLLGIKKILIIFLGSAGVATLSLYFISTPIIIDILFMIMIVFSVLCVMVVNAAVVEIYPTNLRGMAGCLTMLSGRVGIIITSSLVGYLLQWNCEVSFMLIAFSLIGCSLLSIMLPISFKPPSTTAKENANDTK